MAAARLGDVVFRRIHSRLLRAYFTENRDQLGDAPDHDKLTPQMSKLIITSHIKDGLDMAQQYGLPRSL